MQAALAFPPELERSLPSSCERYCASAYICRAIMMNIMCDPRNNMNGTKNSRIADAFPII